jgi:hypothetical protein
MLPVFIAAFSISGCARMTGAVSAEERNFSAALQSLQLGNESGARELLERTIEGQPLSGVTDEALFRLALLNLRDEGGKGEPKARALLARLVVDFPSSIWTRQAAPLAAFLQEAFVLRAKQRELKNLRNQNLSLSRDNKELRQSIERLKQLDMELEQKIRR